MKKTFLAMLMAGCSCAVFAQDDSLRTNTMNNSVNSDYNTLSTNTDYNAYSTFTVTPPQSVTYYVTRDYPTVTNIRWQQFTPDWWHGYYVEAGQPMHVYYTTSFNIPTAQQSYHAALPVRQSWVPDAVVSKSVEMFGPSLYDINAYKSSSKQDVYVVRTLENGQLSNQYIDENGNKVLDVYRMETSDNNAAMNSNTNSMNNNMDQSSTTNSSTSNDASMNSDANMTNTTTGKMKMKTKTDDGKETKTKIKNGKVKTKEY
jgi:hypothetical protein